MGSCSSQRFEFVFCLPFIQTEVKKKNTLSLEGKVNIRSVWIKGKGLFFTID